MDKAAWCLAHGMIHGDLNIYKAWTRSKINQLIVGGSRGMKSYCLKNYIFGLDFCEYCVTDRTKWLQQGTIIPVWANCPCSRVPLGIGDPGGATETIILSPAPSHDTSTGGSA